VTGIQTVRWDGAEPDSAATWQDSATVRMDGKTQYPFQAATSFEMISALGLASGKPVAHCHCHALSIPDPHNVMQNHSKQSLHPHQVRF